MTTNTTPRTTKVQLFSQLADARLILRAVRCGVASFDPSTGEFRYGGMRYSTSDTDWLLTHLNRCNMLQRCIEAEKKSGIKPPENAEYAD